jgi:hypothetical protein
MSALDKIAKALTGRIRAFHSSPHDFDKFDISKIGTGEGAQVYGRGLYFAENPAVSGQGGEYWRQFVKRFPHNEQMNAERLRKHDFNRESAIQEIRDMQAHYPERDPIWTGLQQRIDMLEKQPIIGPRTYEVDINARPDLFLKWDEPITAQSADVRRAAMRANVPETIYRGFGSSGQPATGADVYYGMEKKRSDPRTPKKLLDMGIPGVSYLDQGSRLLPAQIEQARNTAAIHTGRPNEKMWRDRVAELERVPQTSNYVVFDPGIIDIVKKYALPGMATGGMGAIAAQDQYGAQNQ